MKKIMMTFVMVLGMMAIVGSNAVEAKTKTTFKNGTVKITGSGTFKSKKYKGNKKVKKVVVGNEVTVLGDEVFEKCKNLKKVTLGKKVTDIKVAAFCECKKLSVVKFDKKLKNIEMSAFWGCKKLKNVKLNNGLKTIGEMAFYGTDLRKVNIPNTVKLIEDGAFCKCPNLEEIKTPGNLKPIKLTEDGKWRIADKVKKTTFKTSINIDILKFFDTEKYVVSKKDKKYVSIDGAVYQKKDFLLVAAPNVKEFTVCNKATSLNLYYIYNPRYFGDDFYFCTNSALEKLVIPKSVTKIYYEASNWNLLGEAFFPKIMPQVIIENENIDDNSKNAFEKWYKEMEASMKAYYK